MVLFSINSSLTRSTARPSGGALSTPVTYLVTVSSTVMFKLLANESRKCSLGRWEEGRLVGRRLNAVL